MKKILTLCVIHNHPHILLGKKKRGFGEGKWNGFGGKVEEGEDIISAARRELKEEAGVEVGWMERAGVIEFEFRGNPEILEVHVFRAKGKIKGEPAESEEMKPCWFHVDEIPYHEMWLDDQHWLPWFIEGKSFRGKFCFDAEGKEIIEHILEEIATA